MILNPTKYIRKIYDAIIYINLQKIEQNKFYTEKYIEKEVEHSTYLW